MGSGFRMGRSCASGSRLLVGVLLLTGFALLVTAPAPALAGGSVRCASVWSGDTSDWGSWSDGIDSVMCELYEPASSNLSREFGVDIKIWLPGETESTENPGTTLPGWLERPHPDAPPNTPDLMAEAIRKTLAALRPHLDPLPIQMVLLWNVSGQGNSSGPTPGPGETARGEWNWDTAADTDYGSPCPVSVYVTSVVNVQDSGNSPADPQDVKSTIAHEIFHCYQKEYFRRQERAAASQLVDGWWVEGTAEFVASQLFPCSPNSGSLARDYRMARRLNLQGRGYSDFLFFTHLADRHGFDFGALKDFIGRMATVGGQSAQNRALSAYPDIGAKFHSFAKDYVDGEISHCAKGNMPLDNVNEFAAADGLEIPLDTAPFTFGAAVVSVEAGKSYSVKLVDEGGGNRLTSSRAAEAWGPEAWNGVPAEFILEGGCKESKRVVFLSTVDGDDVSERRAKLVFEELQTDPASGPVSETLCRGGGGPDVAKDCNLCQWVKGRRTGNVDRCLVGRWELVYGLWEHELSIMQTMAPGLPITLEHTGNRILYIRQDGTLEHLGVTMTESITAGDGGMTRSSWINPGSGEWNAHDGKLELCVIGNKEAVHQEIQSPKGNFRWMSKVNQNEHIVSGNYDYSCGPTDLVITARVNSPVGEPPKWIYRRVTGPGDPCHE